MTPIGSRCDGAQCGEMPNPPYKGGCPKDRGVGLKLLPNVKHKSLIKLITGKMNNGDQG